jgi:hypothetical protein
VASTSEIVAHARRRLEFLENEFGARPEADDPDTPSVLAWVTEPNSFELELDWREQAAFLLVARTQGGRRPDGYYLHDGRRIRIHLSEVLGDPPELRAVVRRSGPEAMREQIDSYASLLEQALRSDDPRLKSAFRGGSAEAAG